MDPQQILQRWRAMVINRSAEVCLDHTLVGFFQAFRPDGHDLTRVFEGVVHGGEILKRLLEVYEATAPGWDACDAYFIVNHPTPISTTTARERTLAHLQRFAEIAHHIGAVELTQLLEPLPSIEVVQGQTPWPPDVDSPESLMYEVRADFIASLTPTPSDALLLEDALYYIACDYLLRDYILWPLYRSSSPIGNPFDPYFGLWKHGADMRFVKHDLVRVFIPVVVG